MLFRFDLHYFLNSASVLFVFTTYPPLVDEISRSERNYIYGKIIDLIGLMTMFFWLGKGSAQD